MQIRLFQIADNIKQFIDTFIEGMAQTARGIPHHLY